jgi:hypothetical protein
MAYLHVYETADRQQLFDGAVLGVFVDRPQGSGELEPGDLEQRLHPRCGFRPERRLPGVSRLEPEPGESRHWSTSAIVAASRAVAGAPGGFADRSPAASSRKSFAARGDRP